IYGLAGTDHFYFDAGDDRYEGGDGYNQVNLDGVLADYVFTQNADGTVQVVSTTYGTDTLVDIDGVWMNAASTWHSVDDLIV
ncbi:MAG: hypothetical protein AAF141_13300, partial [Pseudomonadota bacterium]